MHAFRLVVKLVLGWCSVRRFWLKTCGRSATLFWLPCQSHCSMFEANRGTKPCVDTVSRCSRGILDPGGNDEFASGPKGNREANKHVSQRKTVQTLSGQASWPKSLPSFRPKLEMVVSLHATCSAQAARRVSPSSGMQRHVLRALSTSTTHQSYEPTKQARRCRNREEKATSWSLSGIEG